MPKMLMISLAASSALAGAAFVQLLHWREGSIGSARAAAARAHALAARMWGLVMPSRLTSSATGNASFEAYRADAVRALEDEQREFDAFVERLRHAADMEAFQAFLASRRNASDEAAIK